MVELTGGERQRLDELAQELARDNPRLARALAGRSVRLRPRRGMRIRRARALDWFATVLIAAAAPLLTVGVVLAQPLVAVAGGAAMITGPLVFTALRTRWPPR